MIKLDKIVTSGKSTFKGYGTFVVTDKLIIPGKKYHIKIAAVENQITEPTKEADAGRE